MGTFEIKNSTLNTNFEYKDAGIIVQGNFVKDTVNGTVQSVNGTCYRNTDGNVGGSFGFFNGYPNGDGEIVYDLSQMIRKDSDLTWDAIDAIEAEILGENEGE